MKKILSVLFLFVATVLGLHAQELVSPNGNFKMTFSLNAAGRPVYSLTYKGRTVVRPSMLGIELKREDPNAAVDFEFKQRKDAGTLDQKADLMTGFRLTKTETSAFDETW